MLKLHTNILLYYPMDKNLNINMVGFCNPIIIDGELSNYEELYIAYLSVWHIRRSIEEFGYVIPNFILR